MIKWRPEVKSLAKRDTAAKRARQAEARRLRNAALKATMRTAIRRFREAVAAGNVEEAKVKLQHAVRLLDKAASKGAIHRNQASRRKSRLQQHFNVFQNRAGQAAG